MLTLSQQFFVRVTQGHRSHLIVVAQSTPGGRTENIITYNQIYEHVSHLRGNSPVVSCSQMFTDQILLLIIDWIKKMDADFWSEKWSHTEVILCVITPCSFGGWLQKALALIHIVSTAKLHHPTIWSGSSCQSISVIKILILRLNRVYLIDMPDLHYSLRLDLLSYPNMISSQEGDITSKQCFTNQWLTSCYLLLQSSGNCSNRHWPLLQYSSDLSRKRNYRRPLMILMLFSSYHFNFI